jgi:hypothetical protein
MYAAMPTPRAQAATALGGIPQAEPLRAFRLHTTAFRGGPAPGVP